MVNRAPLDPGLRLRLVDGVPPSLMSGRLMGAPSCPDLDEHRSARVRFEETAPESWITRRRIRFELSEGALIRSIEFHRFCKFRDSIETGRLFCNLAKRVHGDYHGCTSVTVDGNSFTISGLEKEREQYKDLSSMDFTLYLSLRPGFSGRVCLGTVGQSPLNSGLAIISPIEIAQARSPLSVSTAITIAKPVANYLTIDSTAPIELRETGPGSLSHEAGKNRVEISLADNSQPCSAQFLSQPEVRVVEGDLRIKNVMLRGGLIRFDVERASSVSSTIVVSNIAVGIGQPLDSFHYNLCVGGSAIAANSMYSAEPHQEPDPDNSARLIPVTKELFDARGIECSYISSSV